MRFVIPAIAAALVAVSSAAARAAEPPVDIASLFPPTSLAYAELYNPAELAPQLAAVFKGTVLEDSIPFIHARKDAAKTPMALTGKQKLALIGLFTAPEMLAEFKKLRVAAALTGFTVNGEPEGAIVILTHDSPAAGLVARAFITMSAQLRKVGEVSKVPVFQFRAPNVTSDPNGNPIIQNDKPLSDAPHEMTLAYTPGLFVIGTSKSAVGHAIARFVGDEKDGGLAGNEAFKTAAAAHRKTGLFYFVNVPEFCAKSDAAARVRGNRTADLLRGFVDLGEADVYAWFQMVANARAMKSIAGCVRFRDGGISAAMNVHFDLAQKGPLLELLSGPGVKTEFLHHARRPATMAFAVTLPEKNRAPALLGFLDAIAKANGEIGRLPGDVAKELSTKYKLSVADDLLGRIRAVTVFMPTAQELPKGAKPGPILILHADDAAAASAWEAFVPKVIGELAGSANPPEASTETIDGTKVYSVAAAGLRWNAPIHYARNGGAIAIGLDRKRVAAAVAADASASVIGGGHPPGRSDSAAAFGVISLGNVVSQIIEKPQPEGPVVPRGTGRRVLPNGNPVPDSWVAEEKKLRKAFLASLDMLPPAALTIRRSGNELQIELFQSQVQNGGLKPVIGAAADWLDTFSGLSGAYPRIGELDISSGRW